ncbi:hypothetical protein CBZ_27940 [Cellulomonas biazotea]|uniref:Uncharacterized protein n=1 Tax=Cellulomonas biazotea TaxID=1709 RepID=A0A402DUG5_9CELL|nr:hypothetical protein CBZ_27940 [Cellulomonas biazotea]
METTGAGAAGAGAAGAGAAGAGAGAGVERTVGAGIVPCAAGAGLADFAPGAGSVDLLDDTGRAAGAGEPHEPGVEVALATGPGCEVRAPGAGSDERTAGEGAAGPVVRGWLHVGTVGPLVTLVRDAGAIGTPGGVRTALDVPDDWAAARRSASRRLRRVAGAAGVGSVRSGPTTPPTRSGWTSSADVRGRGDPKDRGAPATAVTKP